MISKWILPGLQSHIDEKRNAAEEDGCDNSHYIRFGSEEDPFTWDEVFTVMMVELMQGLLNCSFEEVLGDDWMGQKGPGGLLENIREHRLRLIYTNLCAHTVQMREEAK